MYEYWVIFLGTTVAIVIIIVFFMRSNPSVREFKENINEIKIQTHIREYSSQGIPPVYYINLETGVLRKKFMESQFSKYNIKYKRINGIVGKNIKNTTRGTIQGIDFVNVYNLSRSELGCVLSHLTAIEQAYKDGCSTALIFEDDTCLDLMPLWEESLSNLVDQAPLKWDILQLFSFCSISHKFKFIPFFKSGHFCASASAYLINRKGMEKILNLCKPQNTWVIAPIKNSNSPSKGVADFFIFCLVETFTLTRPIFFPYNDEEMNSTIHPSHLTEHIFYSNEVIKFYIHRNPEKWFNERCDWIVKNITQKGMLCSENSRNFLANTLDISVASEKKIDLGIKIPLNLKVKRTA